MLQSLTLLVAENAKDASKTIPRSLMISYSFNAVLAFVAGITLIFCVGDVNEVLSNPNQTPFIMIFVNSTKSKAATVIMTVPIIMCFQSALISEVATASRQMWSFARDGGLPGGHLIEPVFNSLFPQATENMKSANEMASTGS